MDACESVQGISHKEETLPKETVSLNMRSASIIRLERALDPVVNERTLPEPLAWEK